jgi:hypothetical protein
LHVFLRLDRTETPDKITTIKSHTAKVGLHRLDLRLGCHWLSAWWGADSTIPMGTSIVLGKQSLTESDITTCGNNISVIWHLPRRPAGSLTNQSRHINRATDDTWFYMRQGENIKLRLVEGEGRGDHRQWHLSRAFNISSALYGTVCQRMPCA